MEYYWYFIPISLHTPFSYIQVLIVFVEYSSYRIATVYQYQDLDTQENIDSMKYSSGEILAVFCAPFPYIQNIIDHVKYLRGELRVYIQTIFLGINIFGSL